MHGSGLILASGFAVRQEKGGDTGCGHPPCRAMNFVTTGGFERSTGSRRRAAAGDSLEQRFHSAQGASRGIRSSAGLPEFQQAFVVRVSRDETAFVAKAAGLNGVVELSEELEGYLSLQEIGLYVEPQRQRRSQQISHGIHPDQVSIDAVGHFRFPVGLHAFHIYRQQENQAGDDKGS